MPRISVIRKKGKRYVKIGKKQIKVDNAISERELVQWLIKRFHPKRKRRKASKSSTTERVAKPIIPISGVTMSSGVSSAIGDSARIRQRDADDKLAEVKKKIEKAENDQALVVHNRRSDNVADARSQQNPRDHVHRDDVQRIVEEGLGIIDEKDRVIKVREKETREAKEAEEVAHMDRQKAIQEAELAVVKAASVNRGKEKLKADKALAAQKVKRDEAASALEAAIRYARDKADKVDSLRARASAWNKDHPDDMIVLVDPDTRKKVAANVLKADKRIAAQLEWNALKEEILATDLNAKDRNATYRAEKAKYEAMEAEYEAMLGEGKVAKSKEFVGSKPATRGLSDYEIDKAMKDSKPEYLGCYAANEMHLLKPGREKRVCWIMNTDPRGQPGTHWVAFFIDARPHGTHSVEYYDPLSDPMPAAMFADLKKVVRAVNGEYTYLKFRQNNIPDQSETSNNCGPFCIHFLKARLSGQSFAKATGWDQLGEENIIKWKPYPKLWISSQYGEGLRDIYESVKKGATKIIQRIKETLGGPRAGPSPAVRGWLDKFGDFEITDITVCKKPVETMVSSVLNWISGGKLKENMKRMSYESLMHLYCIVSLKDGPTVKIEKNQVIEIKPSTDMGKEKLKTSAGSTVQARMAAGERKQGVDAFWKYDAVRANCQDFTLAFLGETSPDVRAFIKQDVGETLKDMGYFEKAAKVLTDVAATADVALNGAGRLENPRIFP